MKWKSWKIRLCAWNSRLQPYGILTPEKRSAGWRHTNPHAQLQLNPKAVKTASIWECLINPTHIILVASDMKPSNRHGFVGCIMTKIIKGYRTQLLLVAIKWSATRWAQKTIQDFAKKWLPMIGSHFYSDMSNDCYIPLYSFRCFYSDSCKNTHNLAAIWARDCNSSGVNKDTISIFASSICPQIITAMSLPFVVNSILYFKDNSPCDIFCTYPFSISLLLSERAIYQWISRPTENPTHQMSGQGWWN